ncbi:MAG: radical SAM protein [Deltaproteobacteria bacterium]|nr:radical SAM protein [Deltaproteobacteria bacterium]MBN2671587.1 radical SAM protein [Deltaproteobacteria bacterium]
MSLEKPPRHFHIYLVKPSHYDDDGYPITWRKALIPSNSLAALNALCEDFKQRQVLGKQVSVHIHVVDETNTRIRPSKIAAAIHRPDTRGFVGMVGVQTNQFPRAMDLCDAFTRLDVPVCVGGFHVSGYLSVMGELPKRAISAQQQGVSFFTGECEEGRIDTVLCDAFQGRLAPLYNFLGQLPDIAGAPTPILPLDEIQKTEGHYAPFDLGRGCPFQCSFCTIINVHGQKSRFRTADDLEKIIRSNYDRGVRRFFLTDDNIARNKNWESLFDRLHQLRVEGLRFRIFCQLDIPCHKIPNFAYKALQAGIDQLLIGMESVNPENLESIQKKQNKAHEYKEALSLWKRHRVVVNASYIVGLPHDTVDSIREDVETIKRDLPVDAIYFTNLTPLPGSQLHRQMLEDGQLLDPDDNAYDTNHYVFNHSKMSTEEWREANKTAWKTFYTIDHMRTIIKRLVAQKSEKRLTTIYRLAMNHYFGIYTTIHPIDGGLFRKRYRTDRRPTLPKENPLVFYPKHFANVIASSVHIFYLVNKLWRAYKKFRKDPGIHDFTDNATSDY